MKKILFSIIYGCILIFPILFIAVPRTTTALSTILALLAIIHHFSKKNNFAKIKSFDLNLIFLAFGVYTIAIILTQISINKFYLHEFQQQGRLLLFLPIFYLICVNKIDLTLLAKYIIPITTITGAVFSIYVFPAPEAQWPGRHTIQHIDPLNFGYLMLFLAFASLIIALRWSKNILHKTFCLAAFIIGIYMSFKSGSRTGWLAIPFASLWILFSLGRFKISRVFVVLLCIALVGLYFYASNYYVFKRVTDITDGLNRYVWNGIPQANETSVGVRISMLRISWYCFTQAPWFGFGPENLYSILNVAEIKDYAKDSTIKLASSGFMHNEFLTQVVKHGIFGGLTYLFILYCIARIYIKSIKLEISSPMIDIFIIYITFAVIASLSTEILIVKPMILFFGFMFSCFAGEALWRIHELETRNKSVMGAQIA